MLVEATSIILENYYRNILPIIIKLYIKFPLLSKSGILQYLHITQCITLVNDHKALWSRICSEYDEASWVLQNRNGTLSVVKIRISFLSTVLWTICTKETYFLHSLCENSYILMYFKHFLLIFVIIASKFNLKAIDRHFNNVN